MDGTVKKDINGIKSGLWDQMIPIVIVLEKETSLEPFESNQYYRRHPNVQLISFSFTPGLLLQRKFDVWMKNWQTKGRVHQTETIKNHNPNDNILDYTMHCVNFFIFIC